MRPALWSFAVLVATLVTPADSSARARHAARGGHARQAVETPTLTVDADTKLLVIAPHPDDETLSSGGLMQQTREAGGQVKVIYLTDGDGYPEGVRYKITLSRRRRVTIAATGASESWKRVRRSPNWASRAARRHSSAFPTAACRG